MTTIYHGNSEIEPFDLSVTLPIQSADNTGITLVSSVIIPDDVNILDIDCFYNCSSLSSISIPSSVTSLGESCFYNCSSLSSISIPSSVTSLGENCFGSCTSLSSVNIPLAITTLPGSCFSYCSSLVSIDIPSSVVSIGQNCFSNCSSLNSVIIPSSVTSLDERCFNICNSLKAVYFKGSPLSIASRSFYGDTFTALIPSPASSECLLHLSAQGSTTSSISAANGVKDISGRGNHGQAYGTTEVYNDTDFGYCFKFTSGYANIPVTYSKNISLLISFKRNSGTPTRYASIFNCGTEYKYLTVYLNVDANGNGQFKVYVFDNANSNNQSIVFTYPNVDEIVNLIVVVDYDRLVLRAYLNGTLFKSIAITPKNNTPEIFSSIQIGGLGANYHTISSIADLRLFGRALSDTEVAQLYKSVQWTPKIKSSTYGGAARVTWAGVPTSPILAFDAVTSTTGSNGVKDISGNGNHGTLTGTNPVILPDDGVPCFDFTGAVNNGIDGLPAKIIHKSGISYCYWVKNVIPRDNSSTGWPQIIRHFSSTSPYYGAILRINKAATLINVQIYDGSSSSATYDVSYNYTFNPSLWYHIVTTIGEDTGLRVYLNGVLVINKPTYKLSADTSSLPLTINKSFSGAYKMRDIRIYDKVLTPAEVVALHDNTKADISPLVLAYKINQVNTATARYVIDYAEDATNYKAITYSGTTPNMGSWESWINSHFTPVMLKSNGTVDYELNRNNLNYKADGTTASDISNTSYNGNAMLRIKKFYISCSSKTVGSGSNAYTVHTIKMCDSKIDNTYTCWGFVNDNGVEKPFAYYALFNCHKDSNGKLRSISGVTLNDSRPGNQLLSYNDMVAAAKANGTGWDISNLALENAIGLVLMMLYKSVNPTFINQEYVDLYKQAMSVYQVTGTRNADGGFPYVTATQKQKALWIESFWRNYDNINQSRPWINGLASLRTGTGSNDFLPYYRKQPPYDDFTTISNWTPMSSTTPHAYMSDAVSHELKTVMFYDNIMFPKDGGVARQGSITAATINRYFGGGEISGSTSTSLQYTDKLLPAQTGGGVMQDQYSSMPHYLGYSLVGTGTNNYQKYGSGRLIYMPS